MRQRKMIKGIGPLLPQGRPPRPANFLRLVSPVTGKKCKPVNNLPASLTPFIGRQAEIDAIGDLIVNTEVRLVTLYGTAGTGKTRLSLAVGENLRTRFRDGVCFVNLATLNKPNLGLTAIAQSLDLSDHGPIPLLQKIQNYLQKRELLLILDNFEQILPLGLVISELLTTCPALKVLVTSRVVLQLYGEQLYPVPPLSLVELQANSNCDAILQNEAVRLFIQRARMVNPSFKLNQENITAIAALCIHSEGLPLTIELAAARCNLFSPQALLNRLAASGNVRFELLAGELVNLPARQQSLANALEWSYELLTEPEKQLFTRLGVFAGGCSLESARAMSFNKLAASDLLISLLNKSLLMRVEAPASEELRFTMLETIREYALEKLTERGELDQVRKAYLGYFTELVEIAIDHLHKPDQQHWFNQLTADHANVLATLDYLVETKETEWAFRLGGSLWEIWWRWGYLNEGRRWLHRILELDSSKVTDSLQAGVLDGLAYLAMYQDDPRTAELYFERSLAIRRKGEVDKKLVAAISGLAGTYRTLGKYEQALQLNYECLALYRLLNEKIDEANSLCNIAWQLTDRGTYEPAQAMLEEALELHHKAGYTYGVARDKIYLGDILWRKNDSAQAIRHLEEAIALIRQLGHRIRLTAGLYRLGVIYLHEGQLDLARKQFEETIELSINMDRTAHLSYAYSGLGMIKLLENDLTEAEQLFEQALQQRAMVGYQLEGIIWGLEGLAVIAIRHAKDEDAQQLIEEAAQMRQTIASPLLPHTIKYIKPILQRFQKNKKRRVEQGQISATEPLTLHSASAASTSTVTTLSTDLMDTLVAEVLSSRETEVIKLLAQGHSNNQLAKILVISAGTVNNHLTSIYSKLGVNSRTAAIRYAFDHNLI